jgi:hypothetical protein
MTDKKITNAKNVGGDYFVFNYSRRSKNNLQYFLEQFDINDYWIYKSSNTFREVTIEEFYEFKYSGYILFRKDVFNNVYINEQIKKLYEIRPSRTTPNYFNKPLPSIEFLNKIQKINIII